MLNIVICGTPGAGKSSLVEKLRTKLPPDTNYVDISKFAIENQCISSYDETLETSVIDEDSLIDCLEPTIRDKKLNIIECIHADLLPSDLVDWIFVCRADNSNIFDRLKARNYSENKISNNVQAEIFQLIYEEALECFDERIVTQLQSNQPNDLDKSAQIVAEKVQLLLSDGDAENDNE